MKTRVVKTSELGTLKVASKAPKANVEALNKRLAHRLSKLECDGKKRFRVNAGELVTYSEAHAAITEANTADGSLTARGITRLAALNRSFKRVKKPSPVAS